MGVRGRGCRHLCRRVRCTVRLDVWRQARARVGCAGGGRVGRRRRRLAPPVCSGSGLRRPGFSCRTAARSLCVAARRLLWSVRVRIHPPRDLHPRRGAQSVQRSARIRLGLAVVRRCSSGLHGFGDHDLSLLAAAQNRSGKSSCHGGRSRRTVGACEPSQPCHLGSLRWRHFHGHDDGGGAGGQEDRRRRADEAHRCVDGGICRRTVGRARRRQAAPFRKRPFYVAERSCCSAFARQCRCPVADRGGTFPCRRCQTACRCPRSRT